MTVAAIKLSKLVALQGKMCGPGDGPGARTDGGVKYYLGAKPWVDGEFHVAGGINCDSNQIKSLDCSAFVRYTGYKSSDGAVTMPDGSQNQREWADAQGLPRYLYATAAAYLWTHQDALFLCVLRPVGGEPGHVWWMFWDTDLHAPMTLECHGDSRDGSGGVDSRPWNHGSLARCQDCWLFPSVP